MKFTKRRKSLEFVYHNKKQKRYAYVRTNLQLNLHVFESLEGDPVYEFLLSKFNGKRGPKRRLSLEQIVARISTDSISSQGDLKNFHKMIKEHMSDKVPNFPNYENFMKLNRIKEANKKHCEKERIHKGLVVRVQDERNLQ